MNPSLEKNQVPVRDASPFIKRSELLKTGELPPNKELNHWLLWAGISPDSKMPVSHIGIYTDFT